ncbi:MAG: cell division protein ZapA [Muribaculaceae bacterium]|nr:cell division protein ZapA [Muribaculaceae bacterium]
MPQSDKQNITIRLAGLPKMPLAVERADEELMRRAESLVNELWMRWTQSTYAAESQLAVMSRVAFQFTVLYLRGERNIKLMQQLDSELSKIINQSTDTNPTT